MKSDARAPAVLRVPHCSHWGAYELLVQDGRIVGVEPFASDPAPSPLIRSVASWADPERCVLTPLAREGWLERREKSDHRARGRERFVRIGWDEATTLVAEEIRRVSEQYGNASIFAGSYGWASCGRFHHPPSLLRRMLNLVGGCTSHVDTYSIAAGRAMLRHALGDDSACSGGASTLDTIAEHSETLLVFGALSPRTAQSEAGGIGIHGLEDHLRKIVARGVTVVHVSPYRGDMPDWVGADWWPIRPNADVALMLGLAGEVLKAGRHDAVFLARCTSGAEQYLAYLSGETEGLVKDAGWAAPIAGLPAADIVALARRLVSTRSMITVSWSLQRAHHGEQPFWAALGLACLVGQIGLPGGGVGYGYGSLGGVGAPINLAKPPAISQLAKPIDSFIPVARIADMLLNPGETYTYDGQTRTYPDVRLVYWAGGNPYHHHQDLNRLSEAWSRPETIIVQDPMLTPTAMRADIVLPASSSIERNDLAASGRSDWVFAMHKAIEPLGEARSDFYIFAAIAERLGVVDAFAEGRSEMAWLRHLYEQTRVDARQRHDFEMPDFESFWRQGHARCPHRTGHVYLADFRDDPVKFPLATESGKIVLGSKTLDALAYDDCPGHPAWIEPDEWLGKSTARGQLHLISHQPAGRLHSQLDTAAASLEMKRDGREQALLNPQDASMLGIADGDIIRLWNDRGETLAAAAVSGDVREGVAILPTGAWLVESVGDRGLDLSGNPNMLTKDIPSSQFGQGCAAHTCLVGVESYGAVAPDPIEAYRVEVERRTRITEETAWKD